MLTEIQFKKTGNFWFDNGLVGLHRILFQNGDWLTVLDENGHPIPFSSKLSSDQLTIQLESPEWSDENTSIDVYHPHLFKILSHAKELVSQEYLTDTAKAGWIYVNGHYETYRKRDFKMHLKSFFTGKTPRTEGALCVPDNANDIEQTLSQAGIGFSKEKDAIKLNGMRFADGKDLVLSLGKDTGAKGRYMNEDELIEFVYFLSNNSPVLIDDKYIKLESKGFLNTKPKHDFGDGFEDKFMKPGKKICALSGEKVLCADIINGMNFPFLTGQAGEMNFASNLKGKPLVSEKYAFISFFSFSRLNYLIQDPNSHYFILYDSDLKQLNYFYNAVSADIESIVNPAYCSFGNQLKSAIHESEALFSFILGIYEQLNERMVADVRKEATTRKIIFSFTNDGNIFRTVKEYKSLDRLFRFFENLSVSPNGEVTVYTAFKWFVTSFYKKLGDKNDYTWRNRLCDAILNFRSPARLIELYIADARIETGTGIPRLYEILLVYYQLNFPNMKKEMIEKCDWYGRTIGKYAFKEKDKSVLYNLRNAKNRGEFFKVLEQIQFRIADRTNISDEKDFLSIHPDFFIELPDNAQWEEYKSLISIFAMNSYLYWTKKAA